MDLAQIKVAWLATETVPAGEWDRLEDMLDRDEQQRAGRLRRAGEAGWQSYVAAHALGRALLCRQAGGAPADWRFAIGPHGKPEVIQAAVPPCLRLNLSHTRGLAAAVLAPGDDVGVDVEWLGRRELGAPLIRRVFSPCEWGVIQAAGPRPEAAHAAALALWTMKEAYVKATGHGLAQALTDLRFTLDPPGVGFADGVDDDPAQWSFRHLAPLPTHVLSLAVRRPGLDDGLIVAGAATWRDVLDWGGQG